MKLSPTELRQRDRQNLQRRSRATLLWAFVAFVILQAGLRFGIDSCWPELRDPTFEIKARRLAQIIAEAPERPITVLMTGSSITSNLFKAKHLEDLLSKELGRATA